MRISDWSSDVCSSDLLCNRGRREAKILPISAFKRTHAGARAEFRFEIADFPLSRQNLCIHARQLRPLRRDPEGYQIDSDGPQSYQQDPENALQTLDRDHCPVPHALAEVRTALRKVAERARGLSDISLSPARTAFVGFSKLAAGASSLTGR